MTTTELKTYIKNIIELERVVYQNSQIKQKIIDEAEKIRYNYHEIDLVCNENAEKMLKNDTLGTGIDECIRGGFMGAIPGIILGVICLEMIANYYDYDYHLYDSKVVFVGGIIGAIIGVALRYHQYRKKLKKSYAVQKNIESSNQMIRMENQKALDNVNTQIRLYREESTRIDRVSIQLKSTLNEYYCKNIIYPKYQGNIVALCQFYEYLDSGRCSSLEGHEGAYNIYEMELRQNVIISKLDTVINRLDSIQKNQYYLYQEIAKCNSNVKILKNATIKNVELLKGIEQNTAMSSYYNQLTAQNTECIAWLQTLHYSKII